MHFVHSPALGAIACYHAVSANFWAKMDQNAFQRTLDSRISSTRRRRRRRYRLPTPVRWAVAVSASFWAKMWTVVLQYAEIPSKIGRNVGWLVSRGVFREAIGPWPPFGQKKFFDILNKLENLVLAPLCVSTSGQRKFAPPFLKS